MAYGDYIPMVKNKPKLRRFRKHGPLLFFLTLAILQSCANAQSRSAENDSWNDVCYEGFGEDITEFAGQEAVNCGFIIGTENRDRRAQARACVRRAQRAGIPFKFGFSGFGTDSAYCKAIARSSDAQLWEFTVDIDVLDMFGGGTTLWISRCKKLSFVGRKQKAAFNTSLCTKDEAKTTEVIARKRD